MPTHPRTPSCTDTDAFLQPTQFSREITPKYVLLIHFTTYPLVHSEREKNKKLPNEIKISHCNLNKMAVVFLFFVSPDEGSCPLSHKRTGSMKSCRCPAVPAVLLALALYAVFEFSRSPPPDRFPPNGIPSSPVGQ